MDRILLNPRLPQEQRELYISLLRRIQLDGPHVWFSTSGSTGQAKFVALSEAALAASAQAVNTHLEASDRDCWINPLPDFHVGGVGIAWRARLTNSAVYNLEGRWDSRYFRETIARFRGTLSSLVPAQVYDLVRNAVQAPGSLRAVIVGGGVLDPALYRKAKLLGWPLFPSYGLTESASQVATASLHETAGLKILGHIQVKTDRQGTLYLKGPSLLTCYARMQNGSIECVDPKVEGWFPTEDKGCVDGEYLVFQGRRQDFIKVGGESVDLYLLQEELVKLKEIGGCDAEMVLHPMPDARLGHVVAVCVEGTISQGVHHMIEQFNRRVLPFERIRLSWSTKQIPRNALGKVIIHELARLYCFPNSCDSAAESLNFCTPKTSFLEEAF